jgi:hypothetical protein
VTAAQNSSGLTPGRMVRTLPSNSATGNCTSAPRHPI